MMQRDSAAPCLAVIHDVPGIHDLLRQHSEAGNLLPRTDSEIYRALREFYVIRQEGEVAACGALEIFTGELGEVRSLAVDPRWEGRGYGSAIVAAIEAEAKEIGLEKLMALTYVPRFFHRLGFRTVPMEALPEKVWGVCIKCHKFRKCDEIAVLKTLQPEETP